MLLSIASHCREILRLMDAVLHALSILRLSLLTVVIRIFFILFTTTGECSLTLPFTCTSRSLTNKLCYEDSPGFSSIRNSYLHNVVAIHRNEYHGGLTFRVDCKLEIVFITVICVLSILLHVKVFSVRLCYTSEGAILVHTTIILNCATLT